VKYNAFLNDTICIQTFKGRNILAKFLVAWLSHVYYIIPMIMAITVDSEVARTSFPVARTCNNTNTGLQICSRNFTEGVAS